MCHAERYAAQHDAFFCSTGVSPVSEHFDTGETPVLHSALPQLNCGELQFLALGDCGSRSSLAHSTVRSPFRNTMPRLTRRQRPVARGGSSDSTHLGSPA